MLLIVLEHRVETKVVHDLLPGQPNQHRTFFHCFDMAHADHIFHKSIVVSGIYSPEGGQAQHCLLQILRFGFAHALQNAHRLMIQQAYRKLPHVKRLDPFLAHVQLDDRYRPQQRPGHPRRKLRFLVLFLRRDEDHLRGGIAAPPGTSQPLDEARAAVGRPELEHALQLAKVNAQLQRKRRCGYCRTGTLP
ncbi:hypothetical protein D3C81_1361890 [compost metagenome]